MSGLLAYGVRILPGLLLIGACYVVARRERDPLLRVMVLILGFVQVRDAMTPLEFWRLGAAGAVPWLRFTDQAGTLLLFGLGTLALTAGVLRLDSELRALVRWGRFAPVTLGWGVGGGVLAAAPVLLLSLPTPLAARGGAVAVTLLPVLLVFSLAGNLAEEVLFRGFLQGRLEQHASAGRAAVLSALLFAACHVFLASTVTDVGWPLPAFALYEGLICAFLRLRDGVIAAALAHGLAIFLLAGAGLTRRPRSAGLGQPASVKASYVRRAVRARARPFTGLPDELVPYRGPPLTCPGSVPGGVKAQPWSLFCVDCPICIEGSSPRRGCTPQPHRSLHHVRSRP
nr:CPBP family intramembrane glutamic endopeptidase [Nonomuraea sp. K271]